MSVDNSHGRSAGGTMAAGVVCWLWGAAIVWGQVPSQEPTTAPPATPPPTMPSAPALPAASAREAMLEQRILQLESMMNQLQYQPTPGGAVGGLEGGSGLAPSEP